MDTNFGGGTPYQYKFPMVSATATVALFNGDKVLLGLRAPTSDAYPNCWSLPGGFVNAGKEKVESAAIRETVEETGIDISEEQLRLYHVSSDPKTDPRGHVINSCYYVELTEEQSRAASANDDLARLEWVRAEEALTYSMAFDHANLLRRALGASGREEALLVADAPQCERYPVTRTP